MAHWRDILCVQRWCELTVQMEAFVNCVAEMSMGNYKVDLVKLEVKLVKNSINLIVS